MVRMSESKTTEFKLYAPQAKRVSLAGSFNNWNTKTLTAK
jgi:1,4-alpha-glucan branching enzyme